MDRLSNRLRSLDEVATPDLWDEIRRRPPKAEPPTPPRGQRALAAVVALVAALGGLVFAVRAFRTGSPPTPEPNTPQKVQRVDPVTRVAVTDHDGQVSCEVMLSSGLLTPGRLTRITFTYRNEGSGQVVMQSAFPRVTLRDAKGKRLYGTQYIHNPHGLDSVWRLGPNEAVRVHTPFAPIWAGPLRIEPDCWNGTGETGAKADMDTLLANVAAPGPPVVASEALERAIASTGSLFEGCRPTLNGEPVMGVIAPPGPPPNLPGYTYGGGNSSIRVPGISSERIHLSTWQARCVAYVDENPGFAIVDLWFATPRDVPLPSPSWDVADAIRLPSEMDGQVGRWTLMVTTDSIRTVSPHGFGTISTSNADRGFLTVFRAPDSCQNDLRPPVPPRLDCIVVNYWWEDGDLKKRATWSFGETTDLPEPSIWFVGSTSSPTSP
jgi:hypothetical protein